MPIPGEGPSITKSLSRIFELVPQTQGLSLTSQKSCDHLTHSPVEILQMSNVLLDDRMSSDSVVTTVDGTLFEMSIHSHLWGDESRR